MAEFLPDAAAEMAEAAAFYEERQPTLGSRFLTCVAEALQSIEAMPYAAAYWSDDFTREHGVRRLVMREFPFTIVYVTEPALVIVAVAHTKRRPDYWTKRLRRLGG